MKADKSRDESIWGIIVLGVGMLVAVWQTLSIGDRLYFDDQSGLLGILCWIAVGIAIELFGIGLIILAVGDRK